jgi:hypothetical protein
VCRLAALVGGLVWIVDGLVRQAGAAYWNPHTLADYTAMVSYSIGLLGFVAVFVGIRASREWQAGLPGTIAVGVAVLGAVIAALGNFIEDGLRVSIAAQLLFLPGIAALAVCVVAFALVLLIRGGRQRWWAGPVLLILPGLVLADNGGAFLLALTCLVFSGLVKGLPANVYST